MSSHFLTDSSDAAPYFFIEKPFAPDALARKVREVLDAPAEGTK